MGKGNYILHLKDAELMQQVSDGDELATRSLVQHHLSYVQAIAFKLLHDLEEVEDVAQEVFLKLWEQSTSWKPKAKISTWLYTVTRNSCLDRLKKKKPVLNNEVVENTAIEKKEEQGFCANIIEDDKDAKIKMILPQLPLKYREVLTLFYYDELRIKDAAKKMKITEDAFEALLRRSRQKLKKLLVENVDL